MMENKKIPAQKAEDEKAVENQVENPAAPHEEEGLTNKLDIEVQITDAEKTEIARLIEKKKPEITKEKLVTDTSADVKAEPTEDISKQISDSEKKIISILIQDNEQGTATKVHKTNNTDTEHAVHNEDKNEKQDIGKQINSSDKRNIVNLIHDGHEKINSAFLHNNIVFDNLSKEELVDILEDIVLESDISLIKSQVAKISTSYYQHNKEDKQNELNDFISSGGKEKDFIHIEDELEVRFSKAISTYRHNKAKYTHELEQQKQVNLKLKHDLLDELKVLISSEETLKKTYDEFKKLQERWKEIGMIPASELKNLWQSYHFLVEKFFDKVRINRELRDLDLKKNLEAKVALCEKAEELIVEKSIIKSFKLLQYYHDKWREIGPVPSDVKEDIWERFKGITDKINLRRKEHYKELQEEQEANYETKITLCENAKEIVNEPIDTLKGWQAATDKVNELLKLWKTIGRAPKAKNDEIWGIFKGYLDEFFTAKRNYLGELKEQQVNNYNLKLDICTKAEAIVGSDEWGSTTRELIALQKEWKKIGPVPRKYSDKIWKRFRSSCDSFFNRKSDHFKNIHGVEDENLKKKRNLVAAILDFKVEDDKKNNLKALKDFQKQWIETGFVPFKEKDKVQNEYRAAIDKLLGKMDVNKSELNTSDFKDRMEILKSSPDADKRLAKEHAFISGKIRKIKEDLDIWENNIGFFSNSKKSNKLVDEFKNKIEKAKNEITELKARLKLIN